MTNNEIYEEIKGKIINLDLAPGTKIREEDLAAEYGVSRTPVRGIIARLVQDGLLVVIPQKGTFVSRISVAGLNDYIFIRKSIELSVIRKVGEVISEEGLAVLFAILDEQKEICKEAPSIEKSKAFYDNDNKFHQALFRIAGLSSLWEILQSIQTPLNRARIMANLRDSDRVMTVYEQHRCIVDHLALGKKEEAFAAYEAHLDRGFDGLTPVIEQYKDYFIGGIE